jgi:hypothetical protein
MLRLFFCYVIGDFRQHFGWPDTDRNGNADPLAHRAPDMPRMGDGFEDALSADLDRVLDPFGSRQVTLQVRTAIPGFGPIAIFDKSALESFNPDEAVWFDCNSRQQLPRLSLL